MYLYHLTDNNKLEVHKTNEARYSTPIPTVPPPLLTQLQFHSENALIMQWLQPVQVESADDPERRD